MEIVSTIALISINATLVVQLLSFLLFLLVINRVMFQPLSNMMRERDFFIENLNREIDEADRERDRTLAAMTAQEETVRRAANALRRRRRDEGADEARAIVGKALARIGEQQCQAREDVARQVDEARQHLAHEAEVLTVALMEKVLERRIGS